ncbi:MAG: BrnT family toxin, partial [Pyrinomonadaceae bacterium]
MDTEFEWDQEKAESNLVKHGVSFAEAVTVFFDLLSIT